jgi:hypothetical protein
MILCFTMVPQTPTGSSHAHVLWGFFKLVLDDTSFCQQLGLSENERLGLIRKNPSIIDGKSWFSCKAEGRHFDFQKTALGAACSRICTSWFLMHTQMEWVWNVTRR